MLKIKIRKCTQCPFYIGYTQGSNNECALANFLKIETDYTNYDGTVLNNCPLEKEKKVILKYNG